MKNKYFFPGILIALLPVLILRDYTPDNELRYLSIADEALRDGNLFTFTNQGVPYADKPPLYLWIVMFGKWLLGNHYMWFLSFFSILPAFVIVATMDGWIGNRVSAETRLTGKLLLMSCGLFLGLSVVLRMDMLMCMFIVLALHTFYKMLRSQGNPRWNAFLFPVYIFMAVFSKGPVGFLVPLLSTLFFLLFTGRMRTVASYWGWKTWGILLLGCILWFGGVYHEGGSEYLNNLLFHQTVDRAVNSFHHEEPFNYYFISIWYSLAPWSLLLIGAILTGLFRRLIHSDLDKLFLTVLLTTLFMLSFISSKIAIYLAPAFPFFVYLAVVFLPYFKWNHWLALSVAVPAALFCMALPSLVVLSHQESMVFLGQGLFYIAAALLTLSGVFSLYILYRKRNLNRSIQTLAAGLFCAIFAGGWALPIINNRLGYADLCYKAMKVAKEKQLPDYRVYKMSRPESMDVFLHEDVIEVTEDDILADKLKETVLMLPAKKLYTQEVLRKFVSGKEKYIVGPYVIIVL